MDDPDNTLITPLVILRVVSSTLSWFLDEGEREGAREGQVRWPDRKRTGT